MPDAHHLEIAHGLTDLHEIWHGDAYYPSEHYRQLKCLENPDTE